MDHARTTRPASSTDSVRDSSAHLIAPANNVGTTGAVVHAVRAAKVRLAEMTDNASLYASLNAKEKNAVTIRAGARAGNVLRMNTAVTKVFV